MKRHPRTNLSAPMQPVMLARPGAVAKRFSIFPITRARRSTADGPYQRCSLAEITRRLPSGGVGPLLRRPRAIVQICWEGNKMEPLEVPSHFAGVLLKSRE